MTAKWHVRADGSMGPCNAREGNCPFNSEEGTRHFTSEVEARKYSEERVEAISSGKTLRVSNCRTINKSSYDGQVTINSFRDKTNQLFHKIDGYSAEELEEMVRCDIEQIFEDNYATGRIGEVVLVGSRSRGLEHDGSDLDFVVEILDSDEREDDLFNMMHDSDETYEFDGVPIDINPIKPEDSGTINDYLTQSNIYLDNKKNQLLKHPR